MSGSQLITERTTDPRIFRWMLLQSSEVWKDDLTLDQYVSRDDDLTPSKLYNFYNSADPTGIYYFVLRDLSIRAPKTDNEVELLTFNIVCSCEVLVRKSWLFVDGGRDEVLSGCIGSVYTLPQHRSKGFSSLLLRELDNISLNLLGQKGFLSLYSEVGTFYERFGYHSYPVDVVEFPLSMGAIDSQLRELKFEQFDSLIGRYAEKLSRYLSDKSVKQQVAIIPTAEMVDWHHIRSRYISRCLHGVLPDNFGLQIDESFIIFSHDYGDKSLTVLAVYATDQSHLFRLLHLVAVEASNTGYKDVHMWESQLYDFKLKELVDDEKSQLDRFVTENLKGKNGVKNSSLSCLKMLNGSYAEWGANHKWPWF